MTGPAVRHGDGLPDDLDEAYAWPDRPTVRVNFTSSADGSVTMEGRSGGLSGPADRRVFEHLRATCDCVLVGAGTARAERYRPARVPVYVVSGRLDLDPARDRLLTPREGTARPVVLTVEEAPADRRSRLEPHAEVVTVGAAAVDAAALRRLLVERGHRRILCEGGPHLFSTLVDAATVDEVCLTFHPVLAGPGAGRIVDGPSWAAAVDLALLSLVADGGEVLCRYAVTGPRR